jgi:uncharacterized protein YgbK (DUF1537 family)
MAWRRRAGGRAAAAGRRAAVVSGSCSAATNAQVADFRAAGARFSPSTPAHRRRRRRGGEALAWASPRLGDAPVLVYATAEPTPCAPCRQQLGAERAGALVEPRSRAWRRAWSTPAWRRLVVAGGETSGACVQALGLTRCASAPRSTPACPGAMRRSAVCTWR